MSTEAEDSGKKREWPRGDEGQKTESSCSPEDKTKKPRGAIRSDGDEENDAAEPTVECKDKVVLESTSLPPANLSSNESSCGGALQGNSSEPPACDLETALHRLVGGDGEDEEREYLTCDESSYVRFRVGDAKDAPAIAALYHQSMSVDRELGKEVTESKISGDRSEGVQDRAPSPSSSLDLWLTEALGDKDVPPSLFCLLGDVYSGEETFQLAAVALLTVAWEQSDRILRVQWTHVNPVISEAQVLTRRLWLRLSAASTMAACRLIAVQESSFPKLLPGDGSTR